MPFPGGECVSGKINGGNPSEAQTLISLRTSTLFRLTTAIRIAIVFPDALLLERTVDIVRATCEIGASVNEGYVLRSR